LLFVSKNLWCVAFSDYPEGAESGVLLSHFRDAPRLKSQNHKSET
jgi:hypothetical protein